MKNPWTAPLLVLLFAISAVSGDAARQDQKAGQEKPAPMADGQDQTPIAEGKDRQALTDDPAYCPLYYVGQWNGAHHYYCQKCERDPNGMCSLYSMIPATDLHEIDNSCNECTGTVDCSDGFGPGYDDRFLRSADHPFFAFEWEQTRYIPPRKPNGGPGQSDDPDGKFNKAGLHITHEEGSDDVLFVVEGTRLRSFRVLHISVTSIDGKKRKFWFGQELAAGGPVGNPARYIGPFGGSPRHHIIRRPGPDTPDIYITSVGDLEP